MTRNTLYSTIRWCLLGVFLVGMQAAGAQVNKTDSLKREVPVDSLNKVAQPMHDEKIDSVLNVHSPHKAIVRSAMVPGWGQIYNGKYWKLPLVYGALGTTGYIFVTNLKTYKELRVAYRAKYKAAQGDSSEYGKIKAEYLPIDAETLRYNRDNFRRYVDYSALFFAVFWGLNVVDAAVDAHLKSFDVSPDLSLKLKAGYSEMAGTKGISLVLAFK